MINSRIPISMNESLEYLDKNDEKDKEKIAFIKKFVKLNSEKAVELRETLTKLGLMKLKAEEISKVIEILPETSEELSKIFSDLGLEEDEIKKILDVVKEFK